MAVLRCDSCGGDTFEALGEPGYFRCHNCGAASSVKLVVGGLSGAEPGGTGVWLLKAGDTKIKVIKEVREISGFGLKEAKDLVDAADRAPQQIPVRPGYQGTLAQAAASLQAAGAVVRR